MPKTKRKYRRGDAVKAVCPLRGPAIHLPCDRLAEYIKTFAGHEEDFDPTQEVVVLLAGTRGRIVEVLYESDEGSRYVVNFDGHVWADYMRGDELEPA